VSADRGVRPAAPGAALARTLLALAIATVLLALCFRGVDAPRLAAVVARAGLAWLVAAVALNAAIPMLWALQWRLFLPRPSELGLRGMYALTATMAMLANSVPMLLGTVSGTHLLATRGRVGYPTALSILALDQLLEGLAKLAMLFALAAVTPLPAPLRGALWMLTAGVGALLAVVTTATWSYGRYRLPRYIREWAAGLRGVRRPEVLAGGLALGLAMKGAEMGGILAVQHALGVELPLWSALAVLAAVNVSTMVSVSPGNVGVYEGSAFLAYGALGVDGETALALALLQHVAYLLAMAGSGWLVMLGQAAAGAAPAGETLRPLRARS